MRRRGVGLAEVVLWVGLVALIAGGATALWTLASRSARLAMDHDTAQMTACLALEEIRKVAERMVFIDPDQHITIDDRSLTVGRVRPVGDPWKFEGPTVTFQAVPARGRPGYVLLRTESGRTETIRTGPLADVRFRLTHRSGLRSRLSIAVVGMPSERSAVRAVATATISLPSFEPYHHYTLSLKEG